MNRLAAWNFNESSGDVLDINGTGHDFPLSGNNIRIGSGHSGNGLTQSASDVLLAPSSILPSLKTPRRSIAAWIRETSPVIGWVGQFYVSSIDSGSWGILFISNQWCIQARNAGGFVRASVARPTDSLFHHVVGTYDETNVKLYLDGALVSTQPITQPLRTDADQLYILQTTGSAVTIDDLQYFDTALTPSEVVAAADPIVAGRSGKAKVWDGSSWVQHPAKVWNGSSWVPAKLKTHNGTDWITAK